MERKEEHKSFVCFGPGYRKHESIREVHLCPICSSSEPDIVLEELPTEPFRFEKIGTEENEAIRIRSDISMLLHASDMAKKYGTGFVQSMIDMRRPKSSILQSQMDQMSDAQILDTIKSRHLQSPPELLAWSEYLVEQAKDIEREAERLALEKEAAAAASAASAAAASAAAASAASVQSPSVEPSTE